MKPILTADLQDWLIQQKLIEPGLSTHLYIDATAKAIQDGKLSIEKYAELVGARLNLNGTKNMSLSTSAPTISDLANTAGAGTGGAGGIRVKAASERYSEKATPVINPRTGQPLSIFGKSIEHPSEAAMARIGAWTKHWLSSKSISAKLLQNNLGKPPLLTEHERDLAAEVYHKSYFCGTGINDKYIDRATVEECGLSAKALLDDATSGGQYLVPFEFDQAIVRLPYLNNELFPLVDLRTCNSSEVRTAKMGQVTVSWATPEGTAISLFDTDNWISEIAVPIQACTAAVEWGKDFQADMPIADFGAMVVDEFGQKIAEELDRVICEGATASGEPEGFLNASSTISVNSDNAAAGPWTLADYVELPFAIGKQYRRLNLNAVYVSNDVTFQRSRQLKVDPASPSTDQRLLFGMDLQKYATFNWDHRISTGGMTNRQLAFICMKAYRMYRRTGIEVFFADQDWTLMRQNKRGMAVRMRIGGELVDANACAIIADGQS